VKLSPAYAGTRLGTAIAVYGGLSFFICSVTAITQRNAKRILAYSTIANLGLIISSAGMGSSIAVSASIMLIIFHALTKALLFLCAGQIEHITGSRDIEDMTGLIRKAPVITILTAFGILSMIVPPFGVLITKWISIEATASNPIVVILLVLGSAFTTAFWIKWLGTLLSSPVDGLAREHSMSFMTYFPLSVLGAAILGTSIFITPIFNIFVSPEVRELLNKGNELVASYGRVYSTRGSYNAVVIFLVLFAALIIYLFFKRIMPAAQKGDIYLCGENMQTDGDSPMFRGVSNSSEKSVIANLYLSHVINEKMFIWAGSVLSIIIIIVVISGGLL
jgi:ech hydrogenase subunit A